ncbi:hypothetical protein ACFQT0_30325 [Hymenobacter humi]|uniref:Uncharacterized protein n=1 Tax=Hymenobacter humi TaxID=1411620 RepID=A0ABW2UEH5_9BACT
MATPIPKRNFEKAAGRVSEHHAGYVKVQSLPGQRQRGAFGALLSHARNCLERNHRDRMPDDQHLMLPLPKSFFTEEESAWMVQYSPGHARRRPVGLFVALLFAYGFGAGFLKVDQAACGQGMPLTLGPPLRLPLPAAGLGVRTRKGQWLNNQYGYAPRGLHPPETPLCL